MEPSDFALLVTLDALLQEGSVTGAAQRVGLSTPAMSHALARIRERLGDPLLVRSGRGMVLTPRAEALKARVHTVVNEARQTLEPERPFAPGQLARTFVVHVTDYVLTVLGLVVDRLLREEAPGVSIRFVPNSPDDAVMLRDGGSDLAVGIYGDLPQEMRSRQLLTDRFVCVVRADHPSVGKRLPLEQFVSLSHIQVAPRGRPGGYLDDVLREKGLSRHVARAVPYFVTALQLAARTDYVLTISERIARQFAPALGLRLLEVPAELRPYALSLVWHPRFDGDASHRFLRDVFTRAAREAAGDQHSAPRTRLDASDPTSGQTRKRPRKRSA
ncbi:MAG TPA: LysR family transcriptional regulator [Archangium sp.]|uniref:LysR family transcriptional regulator n=1 Tax=Archangium sp. TaxID=1872627 RepID=UPI002E367B02|nr:LysR family transcriptional regulator [Archangium sp.]HEX5754594.1 LysR family transcriptional regulator [Archangium sp.]